MNEDNEDEAVVEEEQEENAPLVNSKNTNDVTGLSVSRVAVKILSFSMGSLIGSLILGYRDSVSRILDQSYAFADSATSGWGLGLSKVRVTSFPGSMSSMVRPFIRLHIVDAETGRYIWGTSNANAQNHRKRQTMPIATASCSMKDANSLPQWAAEELLIEADYSNLVDPNVLFLFEMLDAKPSLTTIRYNTSSEHSASSPTAYRAAKRIAWAFLKPVSFVKDHKGTRLTPSGKFNSFPPEHRDGESEPKEHSPNVRDTFSMANNSSNDKNWRINTGYVAEWEQAGERESPHGSESGKGVKEKLGLGRSHARNDESSDEEEKDSEEEPATPSSRRRVPPLRQPNAATIHEVTSQLQFYAYTNETTFGYMQRSANRWPSNAMLRNYEHLVSEPNVVMVNAETGALISSEDMVPEVYLQWRKDKYSPISRGRLQLTLGPRRLPSVFDGAAPTTFDIINNDEAVVNGESIPAPQLTSRPDETASSAQHIRAKKLRAAVLKRSRAVREACIIPDRLLHRLDVGPEGAMVVSFSHTGHALAVVAKSDSLGLPCGFVDQSGISGAPGGQVYSLSMYDSGSGEVLWTDSSAHHGIIYSVTWTQDDTCLMTTSSDGIARVWNVASLLVLQQENHRLFKRVPEGENAAAGAAEATGSPIKRVSSVGLPTAMPFAKYAMFHNPPVYIYSAVFQEFPAVSGPGNAAAGVNPPAFQCPRILTGAHDGRIRVWDTGTYRGQLHLNGKGTGLGEEVLAAPHQGRITGLVFDLRTRFLVSGDSVGSAFVWKLDSTGWYQILRRLKTDTTANMSISSITMHPDRAKGQILVFSQPAVTSTSAGQSPLSTLTLYSLSTYKPIISYPAASSTGRSFVRSQLSADGRIAVCGVTESSSVSGNSNGNYMLRFWDSQSGQVIVDSVLSSHAFPYPIRSCSWHPNQHMIAIASVGPEASLLLFCAEKENATAAIRRLASTSANEFIASQLNPEVNAATATEATSTVAPTTVVRKSTDIQGSRTASPAPTAMATSTKATSETPKSDRVKDILAQMRAKKLERQQKG